MIFLLILLLAGGAGFWRLFQLRFEKGDIYPPYSSLRADPLGTRVFYESIEGLEDQQVTRSFRSLSKIQQPGTSVLFYLGFQMDKKNGNKDFEPLTDFVKTGGRLVLALGPEPRKWSSFQKPRTGLSRDRGATNAPVQEIDPETEPNWEMESSKYEWTRILSTITNLEHSTAKQPPPAIRQNGNTLPESLPWHGRRAFSEPSEDWDVLYAVDEKPVLLRRTVGLGEVILAGDSYLFSNEAMFKDRQPGFLHWLLRDRTQIIFDETHLGSVQSFGVSTLARRYRLHHLAVVAAIFALLFIWRQSFSFLPPLTIESNSKARVVHDASSTLAELLRRNMTLQQLLPVCWEQWKKSTGSGHRHSSALMQEAEAAIGKENSLQPKERRPLRLYQELTQILTRKKKL